MSAFQEIDSDLEENVLLHTPIPWTDTIRQAEELASADTETLGIRSFDLMHVGPALALETFLADRPEAGNVIKGSGGMRKLYAGCDSILFPVDRVGPPPIREGRCREVHDRAEHDRGEPQGRNLIQRGGDS